METSHTLAFLIPAFIGAKCSPLQRRQEHSPSEVGHFKDMWCPATSTPVHSIGTASALPGSTNHLSPPRQGLRLTECRRRYLAAQGQCELPRWRQGPPRVCFKQKEEPGLGDSN